MKCRPILPQVWDYVEKEPLGAGVPSYLLTCFYLAGSRIPPCPCRCRFNSTIFDCLEAPAEKNPSKKRIFPFTVIPRLLISDQVLPDRWYQWHLMTWAVNMDKKIRGLPYDEPLYESVKKEILWISNGNL